MIARPKMSQTEWKTAEMGAFKKLGTPQPCPAQVVADFNADSNDDGMISRDEFHSAVFELADNWTESIEVNEYIQFLKRGYEGVYGAFERADRMKFPEEFKKYLSGGGIGKVKKKVLKKHRKQRERESGKAPNADGAKGDAKGAKHPGDGDDGDGRHRQDDKARLRDLELPEEWKAHLDDSSGSSDDDDSSTSDSDDEEAVEPMPEASTVEYVVEVYEAKIAADRKASKANLPPPTLALVALEILQLREMQLATATPKGGSGRSSFGTGGSSGRGASSSSFPKAGSGRRSGALANGAGGSGRGTLTKESAAERKQRSLGLLVRSLCLTLEIANHDSFENDWLWLFSRLIGCYTRSGRVKAVPMKGATFACDCLSQLLPLLNETKQRLPHGVKTTLQGMIKSGKNQAYVGYIGHTALKHWLRTSVFSVLCLRAKRHECLRSAALDTLNKASTPLAAIVERQRLEAEESKANDAKAKGRKSVRDRATKADAGPAAKLAKVGKYGKQTLARARKAAGDDDGEAGDDGPRRKGGRTSTRTKPNDDDDPGEAEKTEKQFGRATKMKAARRKTSVIAPRVVEDKRAQATSYGDVTIAKLITTTDALMLVVNLWCATNEQIFSALNEQLKGESTSEDEADDDDESDDDDSSSDGEKDEETPSSILQSFHPKTPGNEPRPPPQPTEASDRQLELSFSATVDS